MDYLVERYPELLVVFFYLVFFLPVIVMNIFVVLVIVSFPFLFLILSLVPKKYLERLKTVDGEKVERHAFTLGRFVRDLRDDLTDLFPFSLPKRTVIIPIQKRILDIFVGVYESVIRGFMGGVKEGFRVARSRDADPNKVYRFKQILLFPLNLIKAFVFIFLLVFFLAMLSTPTIYLVYLFSQLL